MHKALVISILAMVCIAAFLILAQIWLALLSWDIFIKLMITLGLLCALAGIVLVLRADLAEHKKLKDENYLD